MHYNRIAIPTRCSSSIALIDSHCHLNYLTDPDAKVAAAQAAGVEGMLCIAVERDKVPEVIALAERHRRVWASVGQHPDIDAGTPEWILEYLDADNSVADKIVALGEMGLDYFRLDDVSADQTQTRQRENFRYQLELAARWQLPVIVHTRNAEADTIAMLREQSVTGVLHCFTESWEMASAALDLGFYISISGIVTFKNGDNVREVARKIPADRLLLETDAPWLAPVPHRGKDNEPAFVAHTALYVAELRGVPVQTLHQETSENFFRLFSKAG